MTENNAAANAAEAGEKSNASTNANAGTAVNNNNDPSPNAPEPAISPLVPKSEFEVGEEIVSTSILPLIPTEQEKFPLCSLVKVSVEEIETKNKGKKKVLQFIFEKRIENIIRRHIVTEWPVDSYNTPEELVTKREGLKARLKHVYEAYATYPTNREMHFGYGCKNWDEFFYSVEKAFNTHGEGQTPIYLNIPVWLKLTINLKYPQGGFQIPLSPNFIERYRKDHPTPNSLTINPKYETIRQDMAVASVGNSTPSASAAGVANAGAAFPSFPGMG